MRENRLSGLEGGGAVIRSPYPYRQAGRAPLPRLTARAGSKHDYEIVISKEKCNLMANPES